MADHSSSRSARSPSALRKGRGSRLRQFGWYAVPAICIALFLALSFQVNAVKREVLLTERKIIALEREKMMLETEFQTRASQRQLAAWNAVEFGYVAPNAEQFLDSERQLARLSTPRALTAPDPIRVAAAPLPRQEQMLPDWAREFVEGASIAASELGDDNGDERLPSRRADAPTLSEELQRGRASIADQLSRSVPSASVSSEQQP
jgi:hypothetical protein